MFETRRTLLKRAMRAAGGILLIPRGLRAAAPARYPYLQNVATDRGSVLWTTRDPITAVAQISIDRSFAFPITVPARSREFPASETGLPQTFFQHQVDFTRLGSGTKYFYRVFGNDENLLPNDELAFQTAPDAGNFRFLVLGDSGSGDAAQREIARRMSAEPASLVLHTGDVAYPEGTYQTYQDFYFDIYRDMMRRIPFYACVGNHDDSADGGKAFAAVHSFPSNGGIVADHNRYYSWDWGDVHFCVLDSDTLPDPVRQRRMLAWLEQDLYWTQKPWKIAMWHHPPYDPRRGSDPESTAAREKVVPVLERFGVQVVFNGHNHGYARTLPVKGGQPVPPGQGTVYITSGGGGGGLHTAMENSLTPITHSVHHYIAADFRQGSLKLRAVSPTGEIIDTVVIEQPPRITSGAVVHGATFKPELAAGSVVSIFGQFLAPEEAQAAAYPLPTELAQVQVTLNGARLPLYFVSCSQVNVQLPFDAVGKGVVRVTTGVGVSESPVSISQAAPGIFVLDSNQPAVTKPNGSLVSDANPVRAGEYIVIYMTGLGSVTGNITAGAPAPGFPLSRVIAPVEVLVDDLSRVPQFAGLTPGCAGLYQINVQLPPVLSAGDRPLRVLVAGQSSNTVMLPVQ